MALVTVVVVVEEEEELKELEASETERERLRSGGQGVAKFVHILSSAAHRRHCSWITRLSGCLYLLFSRTCGVH